MRNIIIAIVILMFAGYASPAWSADDVCSFTGTVTCTSIVSCTGGTVDCQGGIGSLSSDDDWLLVGGENEKQAFDTAVTPTGGSFSLRWPGESGTSTGSISYNAPHHQITQIAADAWGLNRGDLRVLNTPAQPAGLRIEFVGDLTCADQPAIYFDCEDLDVVCTSGLATEELQGEAADGTAANVTLASGSNFNWAASSDNQIRAKCGSTVTVENDTYLRNGPGNVDPHIENDEQKLFWVIDGGANYSFTGKAWPSGVCKDSACTTSDVVAIDDPAAYWAVPELRLCAKVVAGVMTEDCSTDAHHIGFQYSEKQSARDADAGDLASHPYIRFSLWNIKGYASDAARFDAVQMFDPNPGSSGAISQDVWAMYDIVNRGLNPQRSEWLQLDVRQGDVDQFGWPLGRREIKEWLFGSDVVIGDRWIDMVDADASPNEVINDDASVYGDVALAGRQAELTMSGRCLYVTDASGNTLQPPHTIARMENTGAATPDRILLAHLDGIQRVAPSGRAFRIGPCIRPGDPFRVLDPVRMLSGTAYVGGSDSDRIDSRMSVLGTVDSGFDGFIQDEIGGMNYFGPGGSPFKNFWIQDAAATAIKCLNPPTCSLEGPDIQAGLKIYSTDAITIGPGYFHSGGSDECTEPLLPVDADCEDAAYHVLWYNSGPITITDSRFYNSGDDSFLPWSNVADQSGSMLVKRTIVGHISDVASSGAITDNFSLTSALRFTDFISFNASGTDGRPIVFSVSNNDCKVSNAILIGQTMGNMPGTQNGPGCSAYQTTTIGYLGQGHPPAPSNGYGKGGIAFRENFHTVHRDHLSRGGSTINSFIQIIGGGTSRIENTVFANNTLTPSARLFNGLSSGDQFAKNVLIVDSDYNDNIGSASPTWTFRPDGLSPHTRTWRRMTVGFTRDFASVGTKGNMFLDLGVPFDELSGIFLFGLNYEAGISNYAMDYNSGTIDLSDHGASGTWCLYDNESPSGVGRYAHTPVGEDELELLVNELASVGGELCQGSDPHIVDDTDWRGMYPADGSPIGDAECGAPIGTGVTQRTWAHRVMRMDPEFVGAIGDTGSGGGGGRPKSY